MSTFNQSPETLAVPARSPRRGRRTALRDDAAGRLVVRRQHAVRVFAASYTSYGGTTNGAIVSWPKGIKAKGELRNQYHHVIDIAPTVLAAAGLPQPKIVNGVAQKPIEGVSMINSFDDAAGEVGAHDAVLRVLRQPRHLQGRLVRLDPAQGVVGAETAHDASTRRQWDLCNMADDYSCADDVAAQHPDKLKELQAAFMAEAIKYNVLPLDDRAQERFNATLAGRPEYMEGRTSLTLYPGMIGMKENAFIDVKNRSSSITAELETAAASGVIVAQGGAHGGWSLYVKDGRPRLPTTSWAP